MKIHVRVAALLVMVVAVIVVAVDVLAVVKAVAQVIAWDHVKVDVCHTVQQLASQAQIIAYKMGCFISSDQIGTATCQSTIRI